MTDDRREGFFDDLARGLADGSLTRGKALRLMGAALLGGTLASIPGVALAANPCPSPRIKCRGQCCAEGVTTCQGTGRNKTCGPVTCQSGLTNCNGQCVDTLTDNANCGSCGNACSGQFDNCVNGACVNPTCTSSCCCSCQFSDGTSFCNAATTLTSDQCRPYCESIAPPNTTVGTVIYDCKAPADNLTLICNQVPGGSALQCETSFCEQPAPAQ